MLSVEGFKVRCCTRKRDEYPEAGWEMAWRQMPDFRENLKRYWLTVKYFYVFEDLIDPIKATVSSVVPQIVPQKLKYTQKAHF